MTIPYVNHFISGQVGDASFYDDYYFNFNAFQKATHLVRQKLMVIFCQLTYDFDTPYLINEYSKYINYLISEYRNKTNPEDLPERIDAVHLDDMLSGLLNNKLYIEDYEFVMGMIENVYPEQERVPVPCDINLLKAVAHFTVCNTIPMNTYDSDIAKTYHALIENETFPVSFNTINLSNNRLSLYPCMENVYYHMSSEIFDTIIVNEESSLSLGYLWRLCFPIVNEKLSYLIGCNLLTYTPIDINMYKEGYVPFAYITKKIFLHQNTVGTISADLMKNLWYCFQDYCICAKKFYNLTINDISLFKAIISYFGKYLPNVEEVQALFHYLIEKDSSVKENFSKQSIFTSFEEELSEEKPDEDTPDETPDDKSDDSDEESPDEETDDTESEDEETETSDDSDESGDDDNPADPDDSSEDDTKDDANTPDVDPLAILMELSKDETLSDLFFKKEAYALIRSIVENPPLSMDSTDVQLLRWWNSHCIYLFSANTTKQILMCLVEPHNP